MVLARTVLGVIAAADPAPDHRPAAAVLADDAQLGLYLGFVTSVAVALGGLVDTGRRVAHGGQLGGPGLPQLPPPRGAVVRVPNEAER